jgi:hypothetical protein
MTGDSDPSPVAQVIRRYHDRLQTDLDEMVRTVTVAVARRALDWIDDNITLADTTVWLMLAGYTYTDNFYAHFSAKTRAVYDDLVARIPWGPADTLDTYLIPEAGTLKHTGSALGGRVIVTYVLKAGEQ